MSVRFLADDFFVLRGTGVVDSDESGAETGSPEGLLQEFDEGIQSDAENPIDAAPIPPDFKLLEQSCRERLKIGNAPK